MTRLWALLLAASVLSPVVAYAQDEAPAAAAPSTPAPPAEAPPAEPSDGEGPPAAATEAAPMPDGRGPDLRTLTDTDVEALLNAGGVCGPLTFDLRDIGAVIGLTLPSFIPIDTTLRWNQNRHEVTLFQVVDRGVALEVNLGCQPSSNGAILEYLGITPDRLRVRDRALCTGETDLDGRIDTIDCTVDGRIGSGLARVTSMDGQIRSALAGGNETMGSAAR